MPGQKWFGNEENQQISRNNISIKNFKIRILRY